MTNTSNLTVNKRLDEMRDDILKHLSHEIEKSEMATQVKDVGSFEWHSHLQLYYYHFSQALAVSKPALFSEFLSWARSVQQSRNLPETTFEKVNSIFKRELQEKLDPEASEKTLSFFELGIKQSLNLTPTTERYLDEEHPLGELAIAYLEHLLKGNRKQAASMIHKAVEEGIEIKQIYLHVFQPCQYEIGRLWQLNQLSVAQEHFCTAATQMIMSQLYPNIFSTERTGKRVVASAIGGELHQIGVRMVTDFFEMEGWDTFYLGANCPVEDIISELIQRDADLLALSVTMTHYLDSARKLIERVRSNDAVSGIKILVGGRLFNMDDQLWQHIGADGFAWNAADAIETATKLVEEGS